MSSCVECGATFDDNRACPSCGKHEVPSDIDREMRRANDARSNREKIAAGDREHANDPIEEGESHGIRLTIFDEKTGEQETVRVPMHEYWVLTTGDCYVAHTQVYPKKGTHVLTIKGRRAR